MNNAHQNASNPNSAIAWCSCGQGFSGDAAHARLDAHIANPNPNSTGAMLMALMR